MKAFTVDRDNRIRAYATVEDMFPPTPASTPSAAKRSSRN
jgi:hypothetical protein